VQSADQGEANRAGLPGEPHARTIARALAGSHQERHGTQVGHELVGVVVAHDHLLIVAPATHTHAPVFAVMLVSR
jgi:hypothetical protein